MEVDWPAGGGQPRSCQPPPVVELVGGLRAAGKILSFITGSSGARKALVFISRTRVDCDILGFILAFLIRGICECTRVHEGYLLSTLW